MFQEECRKQALEDLRKAIELLKVSATHPIDYEILHRIVRAEHCIDHMNSVVWPKA